MTDRSADIKRVLDRDDEEFRQWSRQHHEHEERLATLATKPTLTPEEEFEEKMLKKQKLRLKDQMAERIRGYETAHAANG